MGLAAGGTGRLPLAYAAPGSCHRALAACVLPVRLVRCYLHVLPTGATYRFQLTVMASHPAKLSEPQAGCRFFLAFTNRLTPSDTMPTPPGEVVPCCASGLCCLPLPCSGSVLP